MTRSIVVFSGSIIGPGPHSISPSSSSLFRLVCRAAVAFASNGVGEKLGPVGCGVVGRGVVGVTVGGSASGVGDGVGTDGAGVMLGAGVGIGIGSRDGAGDGERDGSRVGAGDGAGDGAAEEEGGGVGSRVGAGVAASTSTSTISSTPAPTDGRLRPSCVSSHGIALGGSCCRSELLFFPYENGKRRCFVAFFLLQAGE